MRTNKNFLYVMPGIGLILFFLYIPALYGVSFSFYDIKYLKIGDFIWGKNYGELFRNSAVLSSFVKSLIFTLTSLVLTVSAGLCLALWVNQLKGWFCRLMQIVILVPWVTSIVVGALLWRWLLIGDVGLLPYLVKSFHLPDVQFLETSLWAMISLIFVASWRTVGYAMLLLLAGLKSIPNDTFEAALVDGATPLQQLFKIKIPLLKTPLLVVMIVLTLSYFNSIELPLTLTGGGPGVATNLISLDLYRKAFVYYDFGVASALAILLFVINLILVALYMKLTRWEYE
jgi:multiple sugar transport system permease protein